MGKSEIIGEFGGFLRGFSRSEDLDSEGNRSVSLVDANDCPIGMRRFCFRRGNVVYDSQNRFLAALDKLEKGESDDFNQLRSLLLASCEIGLDVESHELEPAPEVIVTQLIVKVRGDIFEICGLNSEA